MAITALPEATVHLLGSAQALTTPTSLVKELIDNALDAKATSIDILISPNTIDKIEVRDNGHGIPQEDLDFLGRRGHTSKLRSFEELKTIGGISLGFRGEALASAVQLGLVSVTTRTEGEAVATSVQLKDHGGIASQSRTSQPVGTKVSVTKFMYNLPVRRQTAQKESAKTLKKIKELLHSYAFARPRVRFCLKVTSGGKGSWSFTPRPNDGIKETASQIIGRDAAAQCIEKYLVFSEKPSRVDTSKENYASESANADDPLDSGPDHFTVEVFIPKPKATIIGHSQYISVDSRPVSHDKGTMRKLVSIFKYYARGSVLEGEAKIKDPFLRLNISCPVSSYDPNVEPAKDDVIFQNESLVLEFIEQLFKDVYGLPSASNMTATPQKVGGDGDNFELLMSREKPAGNQPRSSEQLAPVQHPDAVLLTSPRRAITSNGDEVPSSHADETTEDTEEPESSKGQKWSVDMSEDYGEDVEGSQWPKRSSQNPRRLQQTSSDVPAIPGSSLNPWIISKMNAPIRPKNNTNAPTSASRIVANTHSPPTLNYLPTPQKSFDPVAVDAELILPLSTARPRQIINRDDFLVMVPRNVPSMSHEPGIGSNGVFPSVISSPPTLVGSDDGLLLGDDSVAFGRRNDFTSARDVFDGSMQTFPQFNGPQKSKRLNRPFIPPTRAADCEEPQDGLRQMTLTGGIIHPAQAQNEQSVTNLDTNQSAELAWAMDFERRKEGATRQRRKEILAARGEAEAEAEADVSPPRIRRRQRQHQNENLEIDLTEDVIRTSPHKNRYNAAIASLEADHQAPPSGAVAKSTFKTSLPDGDPRAYLMRRQKSMQRSGPGGPLKRAKSTRLPLETIPEADNLHKLMLRYPVEMGTVQNALEQFEGQEVYMKRGILAPGLLMNSTEAKLTEMRIQTVVERWMEKYPDKAYETEYNFDSLFNVQ